MKVLNLLLITLAAVLLATTPSLARAQVVTDKDITTQHDVIPRFCGPGWTNVSSAKSGPWSATSTWSGGKVPDSDDRVVISANTTVTYDLESNVRLDCIEVGDGGALKFALDRSTRMYVTNLMVLPGGTLEIGTEATPLPAVYKAEVIFNNRLLVTGTVDNQDCSPRPSCDPFQYGNGIQGLGKITMHGAVKNPTWLRTTVEPKAGDTTLTLKSAPTGWRVGDKLILPDTRQLRSGDLDRLPENTLMPHARLPQQWEELTVASISGHKITLTAPLKYDHKGPRDVDGKPTTLADGAVLLPHVGNLTRNVVLRSEDSHNDKTVAHTQYFQRAAVDQRYVEFNGLGRTRSVQQSPFNQLNNTVRDPATGQITHIGTNQIGRYAQHFHHNWGPPNTTNTGYQGISQGNAFIKSRKWPLTVHGSHYLKVSGNIAYDFEGGGIVTEDGSESFNEFENNFLVRGVGTKQVDNGRPGAHQGYGMWFAAGHNYIRGNVVANVTAAGIDISPRTLGGRGPRRLPLFRGADMLKEGEYEVADNTEAVPALQSADNEVYSVIWAGLGSWGLNRAPVPPNFGFSDMVIWHIAFNAIWSYYEHQTIYNGVTIRGDPAALADPIPLTTGIELSKPHTSAQYHNLDVQGVSRGDTGISFDGGFGVNVRSSFITSGLAIDVRKSRSLVGPVMRNIKVATVPGYSGPAIRYSQHGFQSSGTEYFVSRGPLRLYDYQGIPGNDLAVYGLDNHPDFVIPPLPNERSERQEMWVKCAGLTNQQCFDQHGGSVDGALPLPCLDTTTHTEIDGIVCPLKDEPKLEQAGARYNTENYSAGTNLVNVHFIVTGNSREIGHVVAQLEGQAAHNFPIDSMVNPITIPERGKKYRLTIYLAGPDGSEIAGTRTNRVVELPLPPTAAPAKLTITSPKNNSTLTGASVTASWASSGDLTGAAADHVHCKLDNRPETIGLPLTGSHTFTDVPAGSHTILCFIAKANHEEIANTRHSITFTTAKEDTAPPPSGNTPPTLIIKDTAGNVLADGDVFPLKIGESGELTMEAADSDGGTLTITLPGADELFPGWKWKE